MRNFKIILLIILLPLFAFTGFHKYYISVTQIDYIQDRSTVQITSRIFIDDLENILRQRHNDDHLTLDGKIEPEIVKQYIETYLNEKIKITINGKEVPVVFIGKQYDLDIVNCYLEIEDVPAISSMEISNEILFDAFADQQNIIKTNINSKKKSFILTKDNHRALLNFN